MNVRHDQKAAMRLATPAWLLSGLALLLGASCATGQGTFQNLDFERATIAPTPVGGGTYPADPAQCFPGWTVGGSGQYLAVMYNDLSLGAPAICLMGPTFPNSVGYTPLQGSYSVLLYYDNPSIVPPPTLSQTGLVPATARSINFLVGNGETGGAVSMNGVNIPLVPIPGGRLAGDISAFADSVAQLTFSISPSRVGDNGMYFDDIQFSTSVVPEPNILTLSALGALLVGWRALGRRPFVLYGLKFRAKPGGAANRSQPNRSETNLASAAAGSGR
jgi:hypothetical protein